MIDFLIEAIREKAAPVTIGLDPRLPFIPAHIKKAAFSEFGETLDGVGEAIWRFNKAIIDSTYDLVPAIKPQVAMYEEFGLAGMSAFARTCAYGKEKGLVVIGDVKRGDIGSTAEAYAIGHLGQTKLGEQKFSAFCEDFVTVNPYLGIDGVRPFIEVATTEDKGIFVLVKTSNPSSGEFQDRLIDGRPLYEIVASKVAQWGEEAYEKKPGKYGYSLVGAVAGATYPEQGAKLRKLMPRAFLLVPGYGAQGGKASDLVPFFDQNGQGAIVNSSRGIIAAYQLPKYAHFGDEGFAEAARAATVDMIEEFFALFPKIF